MADIVVVGGGVGGLAAAIRLAAAGHSVVLAEQHREVGGKLRRRDVDGFCFDAGPSLLTLPAIFDDLLGRAGTSLAAEAEPVRLDPICRYRFADGSGFDVRAAPAATEAALDAWEPGAGARWRSFHRHGGEVWSVAERTFLAGPLDGIGPTLRRLRRPSDLWRIDAAPSLVRRASRLLGDPRLVQWAGRYATYSGSDPYRAPATLSCVAYAEQAFGGWYLRGGLSTLAAVLARAAVAVGVELRCSCRVERLTTAPGGRVDGVVLASGERLAADAVVANVDAAELYRRLLPVPAVARRLRRAGRSSSGFVLLVGVSGRTPGLAHHNVSFCADYRAEFDDVFRRGLPAADPTVYVSCSARTDPAMAPEGDENWFVLVNAPAEDTSLWRGERAGRYRDHLLGVMAGRGWDLSGRIRCVEAISPVDIEEAFGSPGGAIYGTSSNSRLSAFFRPANRGAREGLYLVGGSTHPGGGLPLVALSGAMVAGMIEEDLGVRRRPPAG